MMSLSGCNGIAALYHEIKTITEQRSRAGRAVIPLQPGCDFIAGLLWYYRPASLKRTVNAVSITTLLISIE